MMMIGRFCGAHGLKGHVRVESFLDLPKDIFTLPLKNEAGLEIKIYCHRTLKKDLFLVKMEGISNRNQAETVKGALYTERINMPEEVYGFDLCGLSVFTERDEPFGTVQNIHHHGADFILSILPNDAPIQEAFFVATHPPFIKIDLENRKIIVFDDALEAYVPFWREKKLKTPIR